MIENESSLERRVMEVLASTVQQIQDLDYDSIDYRVALEELSDCTFLLEHGFDNDTVKAVLESTTNGELHYILSQVKLPTKTYTVTIEEHISGEFTVCADSPCEAEDIARAKYARGEFVVEPAPPSCRMMMCVDNETEIGSEWRKF